MKSVTEINERKTRKLFKKVASQISYGIKIFELYNSTLLSVIPFCLVHIAASSSLLYSSPDGQCVIPSQIRLDETQNSVSCLKSNISR